MTLLTACNCDPPTQTRTYAQVSACNVREATITEFHPDLLRDTILVNQEIDRIDQQPDTLYSIHVFEFPASQQQTGNLPNDSRFVNTDEIAVAKEAFSVGGLNFFAAVMDRLPANEDLSGDLLVSSVNLNNVGGNTATLRFFGDLQRHSDNVNFLPVDNEVALDFCNYVRDIPSARLDDLSANAERFGLTDAGSTISSYSAASMAVLDEECSRLAPSVTVPTIPAALQTEVLRLANEKSAVDIEVRIGDVFFYRARNGREFIMAIVDIRAGTLPPDKERVTIMFNEI